MEEVKPSANSRIRISSRRDVSFIWKAFQCDNGSSHHHLKPRNQRKIVQRRIWKPRNHIKKGPIRSRQSWIPCPSENCAPRFSLNKGDAFASFMPDFFDFWVLKKVSLEISFMWWTYLPPRSRIVRLRMTLPRVWHENPSQRIRG